MPSIVYDDFSGGLDLRRSAALSVGTAQRALRNCYITTGKAIKKRPCLTYAATLEAGTKGLVPAFGTFHTFYGTGTVTHANPLFVAHLVAHPTTPQAVLQIHYATVFNSFIYVVVEYADHSIAHHYLDGTSPTHIVDPNCPNTKIVQKVKEKIYCASGGNVRFCKTASPRDWTTPGDAGFIAASINASGEDSVTALGVFRGNLAIFFSGSTQVWAISSDPALDALVSASENIGTLHSKTPQAFANDLTFLARQGVRSVSLAVLTNNLQENDVGSPIDALRLEILISDDPFAIYYPALGQEWLINGTKAYILTYSKSAKITAWSTFDFPYPIEAAGVTSSELYVRSGNDVFKVNDNLFQDHLIGGASSLAPICEVDMFYQDNKAPGMLKQFTGFDGLVRGSPSIAFKYDPRNEALVTPTIPLSSDTRPGDLAPMELCATSVAPVMRHQANEIFQIDSLQLYYEKLGPV